MGNWLVNKAGYKGGGSICREKELGKGVILLEALWDMVYKALYKKNLFIIIFEDDC